MLRLSDCLGERLREMSKSPDLNILLPAGVGDVLWAMCKLQSLVREREAAGQRVVIWLPEGEQKRAGAYLDMLGVENDYLPHLETRWVWDRPDQPRIPERGWFSCHANLTLEQGRRLETWYPQLPMEYPMPVLRTPDGYPDRFALIFPGERNYMCGNHRAATWAAMATELQDAFGAVRFVGAHRDVEFVTEVAELAGIDLADSLINRPLEELFAAIMRCELFVGVASGPLIAATVVGVPTYMAYPRHLWPEMFGTWEPSWARTGACLINHLPARIADAIDLAQTVTIEA